MTDREIEMVNDEDCWIEYLGNLYEFVGMLGMHFVFSDVNNGDAIALSRNTLHNSCFIIHPSELEEIERGDHIHASGI